MGVQALWQRLKPDKILPGIVLGRDVFGVGKYGGIMCHRARCIPLFTSLDASLSGEKMPNKTKKTQKKMVVPCGTPLVSGSLRI